MPGPDTPMLSVHDLVVRYRSAAARPGSLPAVRGVSLELAPGRILGLAGESGSGKTSLARAILCLVPVESGQVRFRGQDLTAMPARSLRQIRPRIQAVFQDPLAALSPRRTVLQTLREPMDQFEVGERATRDDRVTAVLESVGLEAAVRDRYPHELSGGQRQRVCFARALVTEPELIVADEPVSSLDLSVRTRIIELIADLRSRLGVAFLVVSHDLSVLRRLADDVAVMYRGELVETAPSSALFAQPAHPYTRSLIDAIPVPDPEHPRPTVIASDPPAALTHPDGCVFHMRCPERIEGCASVRPTESAVSRSKPEHRVKCHLWKQ